MLDLPEALRGVGGIILNSEGLRFCNELGRGGSNRGQRPNSWGVDGGTEPVGVFWCGRFETSPRGVWLESLVSFPMKMVKVGEGSVSKGHGVPTWHTELDQVETM